MFGLILDFGLDSNFRQLSVGGMEQVESIIFPSPLFVCFPFLNMECSDLACIMQDLDLCGMGSFCYLITFHFLNCLCL